MSFCNLSNNNGIFTLTLASGDGHHYLTAGAITELEKALESVRRSAPARGLVTTSRSGSFCDGLDYDGQSKESTAQLEHRMAEVVRLLLDLPMPTAAAVCGDATSLGLALALAHDHCVLYKEAVLGFPEARLRRRVPKYAVALVREKIANLRLRKLLVLKSQTCTGEELAGTWYSAHGATGHRDEVVIDALNILQGVVVGDGSDYAKVRRTMYTQSCAAVSLTISTAKPPSDESSRIYQSSTTPMDIRLHMIESSTDGFSDQKKVGSGGYGDVYKISSGSKDLAVDPALELRFPFELRRDISCCLQLTNKTDDFIAFNIKTNQKKYSTQPNKGTMAPCCKCYITVTMQAQEKAPPNMQCHDVFVVQSTRVSEGHTSDEITEDLLKKVMPDKVVDEVKLPIVYVSLEQPPR